MIYLDNTTQSQQVYIPRQVIQTATTREINNITSGDVINIVDEKLEPYYTSAETDTQIENAVAAESARCEETYAKISDIPDVSDFVTSADVKTQIEDYHYITSGDLPDVSEFITSGQAQEQINQSLSGYATEQWVEDKHYLTEHQSLSAYSTTEQIEGMIANESARTEETYAKIEDIPDVSNLVTNEEFNELSGSVIELQQSISGFASEEYVDNAVDGAIDYVDDQFSSYSQEFNGYLAEKQDITAMTAYYTSAETDTQIENAIAAEVARADSAYATPAEIPEVSQFITSATVKDVFVNFDVTSGDSSIGSYIRYNKLGGGYQGRIFGRYINGEPIISDQPLTNLELPTLADLQTLSGNVEQNAEDIYGVYSRLMTEYWNSARTVSEIDKAIRAESARTEETYAKLTDIPDVSNFVTSADVETQITGNLSAYTPTSNFATINGSAITEGGNIIIEGGGGVDSGLTERVDEIEEVTSRALNDLNTRLSAYTPTSGFATINGSGITEGGNLVIQGGGSSYTAGDGIDITNDVISVTGRQETLVSGTNIKTINNQSLLGSGNIDIQGGGGGNANIIELTQAEYDALTAYTEDALYVITDAEEVDLNDYATSADVTTINTALGNKADKVNIASNPGYMRFPNWNSQGIITGYTYGATNKGFRMNGSTQDSTLVATNSTSLPMFYAPTTAGDSGQILQSNGSGAPSWSSFKFWYGSQNDYDAITNKDPNCIYFVQ